MASKTASPEKRLRAIHQESNKVLKKAIQTALKVGIDWEDIDELVHEFKPIDPPENPPANQENQSDF